MQITTSRPVFRYVINLNKNVPTRFSAVTERQIDYVYAGGAIEIQRGIEIPHEVISEAISQTNRVFVEMSSVVPYVYELLQMRNLHSFARYKVGVPTQCKIDMSCVLRLRSSRRKQLRCSLMEWES